MKLLEYYFIGILIFAVIVTISLLAFQRKRVLEKYALLKPELYSFNSDFSIIKSAYISHSMCETFLSNKKEYYTKAKSLLSSPFLPPDAKKNISTTIDLYNTFRGKRAGWNRAFVYTEQTECESLFSNISGHSLDKQQQRAAIVDEDCNLVIAGAGSGKTLTITGKVKYLCERKEVRPEDLLLIAFTRKAASEMTSRIKAMGIQVEANTFHKIGLDIVTRANGKRPAVLDEGEFKRFLDKFFAEKIWENTTSIKALVEYFAFYLRVPTDMSKAKSIGEVYEHERNADMETLRSKYSLAVSTDDITEKKTLQGEYVKSLQEMTIANFLFLHGVNYQYEYTYPYRQDDPYRKPYTPDFYLPEYDIYIEHFGIDKNGRAPWLSDIEEKKYVEGIQWKRKLHEHNKTKLLETYSWYEVDGILLSKLEEMLISSGVKFAEIDYIDVFNKVYSTSDNRHYKEFIQLCGTFVSLFKGNGYKLNDLEKLSYKSKDYNTKFFKRRTKLFKTIMHHLLAEYNSFLKESGKVDFSDMIITARDAIENGFPVHSYKYIIIDEFQDVSISQYNLIKAIIDKTGAHLLCVGDDWQSIYRFSGSDISLFTNIKEYFGACEIMRIEKTYRNSQNLVDIASSFVEKNPSQLKKNLKSDKQCNTPISFYIHGERPYTAIILAIDEIIKKYGEKKSILILGRTNYDKTQVLETALFQEKRTKDKEYLIYKKSPSTKIQFMTVHKSKGLEADNVIILNFCNSLLGFPNQIADDPMLELVLSASDQFLYAEERRLLYVALTRTRNETILITDGYRPSEFYHDFSARTDVKIISVDGANIYPVPCPRCSTGTLVPRTRKRDGKAFVGCTNYPQCDYTVNNVSILEDNLRCECGGFFLLRHGYYGDFYGCSNYPHCRKTLQKNT